jgi:hypothetical protein
MEPTSTKPEPKESERLSLQTKGILIAICLSLGIAITVPFCDLANKKNHDGSLYYSGNQTAQEPFNPSPSPSIPDTPPLSTGSESSEISDWGRQLASIDANQMLEPSDPRSVAYEALLISLKNKTGTEKQKIADYTVYMRDTLKGKGVSVTLLFILSQVNKMARRELNQNYETYAVLLAAKLIDDKDRKTGAYGFRRGTIEAT